MKIFYLINIDNFQTFATCSDNVKSENYSEKRSIFVNQLKKY